MPRRRHFCFVLKKTNILLPSFRNMIEKATAGTHTSCLSLLLVAVRGLATDCCQAAAVYPPSLQCDPPSPALVFCSRKFGAAPLRSLFEQQPALECLQDVAMQLRQSYSLREEPRASPWVKQPSHRPLHSATMSAKLRGLPVLTP